MDHPGVDIVGDALIVLRLIPDGSIGAIHSSHFLEHVEEPRTLLQECARVLRPGGLCVVTVPHFSNPYYHSDPTHRTPFGLYTFSYWVNGDIFRRQVPRYAAAIDLHIRDVELGFRSDSFRLRSAIKRLVGILVNSSTWLQEFYEENLVYLFPCYEMRVGLVRILDGQTGD